MIIIITFTYNYLLTNSATKYNMILKDLKAT